MTDLSLSHLTHSAPSVESTGDTTPAPPFAPNSNLNGIIAEDEEDYTIKCICDFQEDDGNTVLCEKCETWQHIECYYSQSRVPDVHNCADCDPRAVDTRRATERPKKKREHPEHGDRKVKKPAVKSHKKKFKTSDQHTANANGWSQEFASPRSGAQGNPKDHVPPAKRPKTSHKASNSVHSTGRSLNPSSRSSKRSVSTSHPIPSQTPRNGTPNGHHTIPYSTEFLRLYDNDPGDAPMPANLFNDIRITTLLSLWSHDVEALAEAANGRKPQDIFQVCNQPIDLMPFPQLNKVCKEDDTVEYDGLHPRWTYLTIDTFTQQNSIVGELRGKIGHMHDYVHDSANRWDYLRHPLPFVFFHDQLPIYIDTRREGSRCRYLRRSCRPNLSMKTLLENGSEYHFCFVANQDLEAGTELTTGWRLDEHISKYIHHTDPDIKQEFTAESAGSYIAEWSGKVLADFGGCACDDPGGCLIAGSDRRNNMVPGDSVLYLPNGTSKKGHQGFSVASSHSTSHATNSRSGSEALKHQEYEEQDDGRSTSGSLRSKPRSRDTTPSCPKPHGKACITNEMELSHREKRKIALVEKSFELQEHTIQSAQKKKKRNSGGSILNTPTALASRQLGPLITTMPTYPSDISGPSRPRPGDTATSNIQSGFPQTKFLAATGQLGPESTKIHALPSSNPSPAVVKCYVDSGVQTDNDLAEEYLSNPTSDFVLARKPYMSLQKLLLTRCHKHKLRVDAVREAFAQTSMEQLNSANDPKDKSMPTSPALAPEPPQEEMQMQDCQVVAPTPVALPSNPPVEKPRPPDDMAHPGDDPMDSLDPPFKFPPSPWSSNHAQLYDRNQHTNGYRSADLRVQLPPKQPFSSVAASTTTLVSTPTTFSGSLAQLPLSHNPNTYPPLSTPTSGMVQPSPARKKISFGEYIRRGSQKHDAPAPGTAEKQHRGSSPIMTHDIMKPMDSLAEEAKDHFCGEKVAVEIPGLEAGGLSGKNPGSLPEHSL